jgi:hypothetical protein
LNRALAFLLLPACIDFGPKPGGDTGVPTTGTGESPDSSDSVDSSDSADSADTADTADSGDTADSRDTGTPGPTGTRGVWAWRDSGDPHGTDAVVGDAAAEADMLAHLQDWGVDRVYGSYGDRAATEPNAIAAWNAQLHAAGIQSFVLMGDPAWTSSREWAFMESLIQARLIQFNESRTDPTERFDGLHLDIEPHAASAWSSYSEADKYAQLTLLDDAYAHAHGVIEASSQAGLELHADLPVWFDNLPAALGGTGSVGWPSAADRDAWFSGIHADIDRLSMMAYEMDDDTVILSRTDTETGLFGGEVRLGLNEEVGTTWATIQEMFDMAETLELGGRTVDLHSYSKVRALVP